MAYVVDIATCGPWALELRRKDNGWYVITLRKISRFDGDEEVKVWMCKTRRPPTRECGFEEWNILEARELFEQLKEEMRLQYFQQARLEVIKAFHGEKG